MDLPKKAVEEFLEIYKRKCGEEISFEEAKVKADNFLRLFALITNRNKSEKDGGK